MGGGRARRYPMLSEELLWAQPLGLSRPLVYAHAESIAQPETVMLVPPSAAKAKQPAPMKIDAENARNTLSRVTRSHATLIMVHLAAIVAWVSFGSMRGSKPVFIALTTPRVGDKQLEKINKGCGYLCSDQPIAGKNRLIRKINL